MTDLWNTERRLWLEGARAYEELMATECVMVFGPMGIMRGEEIISSLRQAPRWADVTMTDEVEIHAGRDVAVLAYRARGERDADGSYEAFCTSTYIRGDGVWRIAQHQQTAIDR